jgi:hypothetical protein
MKTSFGLQVLGNMNTYTPTEQVRGRCRVCMEV